MRFLSLKESSIYGLKVSGFPGFKESRMYMLCINIH
jgi:hypothetical protein